MIVSSDHHCSSLRVETCSSSAESFPWISITFRALSSSLAKRWFSRRNRVSSLVSGLAGCAPDGRPNASKAVIVAVLTGARERNTVETNYRFRPIIIQCCPLECAMVMRLNPHANSPFSREGFIKHWKRNASAITAAAVIIAVAVLFVPKWLAPDVQALRQKNDVAGLAAAAFYWGDADTREEAIAALGDIGKAESIAPLLKAQAASGSSGSSGAAVAAKSALPKVLDRISDDQSVQTLVELTGDPILGSLAKGTLDDYQKRIGAQRAVLALVVAAAQSSTASTEANRRIQAIIIQMPDNQFVTTFLGQITSSSAAPVVQVASVVLSDRLTTLGPGKALRALLIAATDGREAVSAEAGSRIATLLRNQKDVDAVNLLASLVKDADATLSNAAHYTLTNYLRGIGGARSVPAVLSAKASDEWLGVALDVAVDQISTTTKVRGIQLEPIGSIKSSASSVGPGQWMAAAHPYRSSGAFHPMVMLGGQSFSWTPGEPTALRFLELVAFVWSSADQEVEVCKYQEGSTVTRLRVVYGVDVYSAMSGELVASRTFAGSTPGQCDATIYVSYHGVAQKLYGDPPAHDDISSWLNSFVHAP